MPAGHKLADDDAGDAGSNNFVELLALVLDDQPAPGAGLRERVGLEAQGPFYDSKQSMIGWTLVGFSRVKRKPKMHLLFRVAKKSINHVYT